MATDQWRNSATREFKRRLITTFEQAGVGISHVAPDGQWLSVNCKFCEIAGYSREELTSLRFQDIIHPDELDSDLQQTRRMLAGEIESYAQERRLLRKDGEVVWINLTVSLASKSDHTPDYFIVIIEDISERKAIEEALQRESTKLREANRLALLAHWDMELATGVVHWSPEMYQILDSDSSLAPTQVPDASRHFEPESWEQLSLAIDRCAETGVSYELDLSVKLADGHARWVTARGQAIYDEEKRIIGLGGTVQDITQRKQAEEAFQRYATVFQHAAWGMVVVDCRSKIITHVNPAFATMHGYTERELIGQPLAITYAPEACSEVPASNREDCESGRLMMETWHVRKDGSTFPCHVDITVYTDDHGNALFLASNVEDITKTRQTRQELKESAERYHSVIETTQDGYLVSDINGCVVDVNDAYCRMSGYSREELLRVKISDLDAVHLEQDMLDAIERLKDAGSAIFESLHRRKNGEVWDVEVSVSYASIHGNRFFSFIRDITMRKKEQAISELRQTLSDMLTKTDLDSLIRTALDSAEKATASEIGFFHLVEKDKEAASLQVWSTRTQSKMSIDQEARSHYVMSQAGVWVDCIRQCKPVVHNDYSALPHRKGPPEGHTKLFRDLTAPVLRNGVVVAVLGVGNKEIPYTERDVQLVQEISSIAYDYVERKRAEQQIQFMAYFDLLTGLPNRSLLSDRLLQAMASSHRSSQLVGICYLDLDGFKPVNDRYGHDVGDKLLVKLANNLKLQLREGDSLARIGGDEFVILLTGLGSVYECEDIVKRIQETIQIPIIIESYRLHLSASIGITLYPVDRSDADTLLRHADQAMYEAKASGKSKFHIYSSVEDQNTLAQRQLLSDFEVALHTNQLVLHYQPRIDLRSGSVVGVEALIRWNHPNKGMLYPHDFLTAIEDTPMELALGEWVVRNALDQHVQWNEMGLTLSVSVNISPRQIQIQEFFDFLRELLNGYPVNTARHLEIEMLEIAAIGSIAQVAAIMEAGRELGIHFSLDDFGTGYSSLTYFHQLPIDIVKIDQEFVRGMLTNARDLDIVESVLKLSSALERPVVAEGVESIEIGMMLLSLGCAFAQGYGIARPMSGDGIQLWLEQWKHNTAWHNL